MPAGHGGAGTAFWHPEQAEAKPDVSSQAPVSILVASLLVWAPRKQGYEWNKDPMVGTCDPEDHAA